MKIEQAKALLAEAVAIAGCVTLDGYEIRELKGVDGTGRWITGCPTRTLMGYVRIKRSGQAAFVAACRAVVAHRDEIVAHRAAQGRAADLS